MVPTDDEPISVDTPDGERTGPPDAVREAAG
jgi:hypothetical protein